MNKFPERQEGKLNLYMHVSENSGVGYYRQYLPALALRKNNLMNVLISDFRWGVGEHVEPGNDFLFEIANWADIIVVGRRDIGQFYAQWGGIRDFFKMPIIMDTDDNVHHVRPYNPGYEAYFPGSEPGMWNKYGMNKVFDAVTVSTDDLKDFYKKYNPRIFVLPNCIDVAWFDSYPEEKKNDGFIRFGFIGSSAHTEGVRMIKKPVIDILKKHQNTKFVISGIYASLFAEEIKEFKNRIEFIPWIDLQEWPKGIKKLSLDFALAPLADNLFNRAKSNLRWMEFSASRIPVIASNVAPYRCIRDGVDGFLVKEQQEWYNTMDKLIVDEGLRKRVAEAAHKRIVDDYNIDTNAHLWEKAYRETWEKYHSFFGEKKRFEKVGKKKYKEIRT